MKRIHILFATVLSALSIAGGASAADISRETDSLLRVIDRLIVKKPEIVAANTHKLHQPQSRKFPLREREMEMS